MLYNAIKYYFIASKVINMSFQSELHNGFFEFLHMISQDNSAELLLMPYAQYSLQFFIAYKDALYKGPLCENGPLAKAFCSIGIDEPCDQLLIFLDAFYIYWHTQEESFPQAKTSG